MNGNFANIAKLLFIITLMQNRLYLEHKRMRTSQNCSDKTHADADYSLLNRCQLSSISNALFA